MPTFPDDDAYSNVNEFAARQGLIWDGQYSSPYDIGSMIRDDLRDEDEMDRYDMLFDHTKRFRPKGSGKKPPVVAITSPYLLADEALHEAVLEFCKRFGLAARVNDPRDRIYNPEGAIPIVFWRPDLHLLR